MILQDKESILFLHKQMVVLDVQLSGSNGTTSGDGTDFEEGLHRQINPASLQGEVTVNQREMIYGL